MAKPPHDGDDDSISGWLQGLNQSRPGAGSWAGDRREGSPQAPVRVGPIELQPTQDDDGPEEGTPLAKPYFREAISAARRMPATGGMAQLGEHVTRYLRFTRAKLAYLYQGLKSRERQTFSVIPYLLHVNLPGLPGYSTATDAPIGIRGFELHATARDAVERIFGRRRMVPMRQRPMVRSVLAMGSVGTIGQTGKSDVDYWVVVDESAMTPGQLEVLQGRIAEIEAWAQKRGLDAHFFIVDAERTRRNDFTGAEDDVDSSGSAQGKLLKEEFYRTAIYIAGQLPLWWVAPPGITEEGYDRLAVAIERSRLPGSLSFVDLGFIGNIDRGEFFGAALWQINKSLRSPFKSLLKMALLAKYLDDEQPKLLCDQLKERVFQGENAPQYTDPYVLLFDAISEYFAGRGDWVAFRLVQKCFYLKVGLKLSRKTVERSKFMRRFRVMQAYIARWGWDAELLAELDSLDAWSAQKVDAMGQSIRGFMLGLYRHLIDRARAATVRINENDITILGRRLFACFGQEQGKVQHLFTYFLKEPRVEESITVLEVPEALADRRWEVHRHLGRDHMTSRGTPIWSGGSLAEVAGWLTFNGLFHRGTVVSLLSKQSRATTSEFRSMLERFSSTFECPDPFSIPPSTFLHPRCTRRVAFVVNLDLPRTPEDMSEQAGVYRLPENWDILNYGFARQCQLRDISVVTLNSWGEVFCRRYQGQGALPDAVRALYESVDSNQPLDAIPEILAPSDRTLQPVRNRLKVLLETTDKVFMGPLADRECRAFVYEVGGRFQVLLRSADGARVCGTRSARGVCRLLGNSGYDQQLVYVDQLSPSLGDLRATMERHEKESTPQIYVGWRHASGMTTLLVIDATRRVFQAQLAGPDPDELLLKITRRIIHRLRGYVTSAAELRRTLHVFEMREGRALGFKTVLAEDTLRVLGKLAEPRKRRAELRLHGRLSEGRQGLFLTYGKERFGPDELGRRFVLEFVARLLRDAPRGDRAALELDGSNVDFGPAHAATGPDLGIVKHLRLLEIYDGLIRRAVAKLHGRGANTLASRNGYRRAS